jgi:hypothetical protein
LKQSGIDKCLFICHDYTVIVYIDVCKRLSPSDTVLDDMLHILNSHFKIMLSHSINTYLGLEVTQNADGTITLRQPGLIDKVIKLCSLKHEPKYLTPADKILQESDGIDAPHQHQWSHLQAIVLLNYIAATSCPDINFAVHQCAQFSTNPKRHHEIAVQHIIQYLKGAKDKGYILRQSDTTPIDCYADADFAGSWTLETSANPSSVKSRIGYIITFANCPILCTSKLQSEIALCNRPLPIQPHLKTTKDA